MKAAVVAIETGKIEGTGEMIETVMIEEVNIVIEEMEDTVIEGMTAEDIEMRTKDTEENPPEEVLEMTEIITETEEEMEENLLEPDIKVTGEKMIVGN